MDAQSKPWRVHETYSTWRYARKVENPNPCNNRFYFIIQSGPKPEICALVDGDLVVKEFLILNKCEMEEALENALHRIDGVVLEEFEFVVSPDGERYAFPCFVDSTPHLFMDGEMHEVKRMAGEEVEYGRPYRIWFSPDSNKLFSSLVVWNPINESDFDDEGSDDDDDDEGDEGEGEFFYEDEPAGFFVEKNGPSKPLLARPGSLRWIEFLPDSRPLSVVFPTQDRVQVKVGPLAVCTADEVIEFTFLAPNHENGDMLALDGPFVAYSPDKRFFLFAVRDKGIPKLLMIDSSKIESTNNPSEIASWVVGEYDGIEPIRIFWNSGKFQVTYLNDEQPLSMDVEIPS